VSYVSRREEELLETKRSQSLALQILEVFTGQSTQDLHRLNLLSSVWQSVDKNILRTLDDAQGKEGVAKLLCELIVWKALEYWVQEDGTPCGESDAVILKRFKDDCARRAAEDAAKPPKVKEMPLLGPLSCGFAAAQAIGDRRARAAKHMREKRAKAKARRDY
jgi:hypothetical protein